MNSLQASRISGGNSATGRRQSDFYPTPPEATIALLQFLDLPVGTVVWEPACGECDMVRAIQDFGLHCYGTDINAGQDFLTYRNEEAFDWIITNPPFALAEDFIRRAAKTGRPFAMLLKSQYWHAARRVQLFRDLPPIYVLPLTWRPDFFFKDRQPGDTSSPLMDVMWCVRPACTRAGRGSEEVETMFRPLERPERRGK